MYSKESLIQSLSHGKDRFEERKKKLIAKSKKFSFYRLIIFLLAITLFLTFFFTGLTTAMWISLLLFTIIFGILTGLHNKLDYGIKKNSIWISIKENHLARINLDWEKIPKNSLKITDEHPFASDLSIIGDRSIHQLINTSVSEEGCLLLKEWLTMEKPELKAVLNRQMIIKEMARESRFRDKLLLNSYLISQKSLKGSLIEQWFSSPSELKKIKQVLTALFFIIPINILLFVLFLLEVIPAVWAYTALLYIGIHWFNLKYISDLFEKTVVIENEFAKFSAIFDFIEKFPYKKNSFLEQECKIYKEHSPSRHFRRLKRIAYAATMQKNPLTALIFNAVFPWDFFFSYKLEKFKVDSAAMVPEWLNTWYRLEALNSLSNFAYLNPDYSFPHFNPNNNEISAVRAAHPLIHYDNNIPNDFKIEGKGNVYIITGSNMSGKSTFLKTIGTNLVLAYAGSSVNAESFTAGLVRLFTCINISDSVIDGISYFYAEVKRLKFILNSISEKDTSVFFLIDEIFRGTNNKERLIGSRSYIKMLAGLNASGLISTHDLELTKLEDEIPLISNYHFREEAAEGKMIFDYKLHEGPCPTTNALKIMQMEGLPITDN